MKEAQELKIYIDETDSNGDVPLYEIIVRRLLALEAAGATVLRGIMGFGRHGRVHRKRLFGVSDDRPVMISVVDSPEKIERILQEIRPMVKEGLVVVSPCTIVSEPGTS